MNGTGLMNLRTFLTLAVLFGCMCVSSPVMSAVVESTAGNLETEQIIDLVAGSAGPRELIIDREGSLNLRLFNFGSSTAENIRVHFYIGDPAQSGIQVGEAATIDKLEPKGSAVAAVASTMWTPDAIGSYDLYAWIDPYNTILESDEDNNVFHWVITVRNPAANLWISSFSIGVYSYSGVLGEDQELRGQIANLGEISADNVVVKFYLDSPNLDSHQIGETTVISHLIPGQYKRVETSWIPDTMGQHRVYIVVDPDDTVVESDESNNQRSESIDIFQAGIELVGDKLGTDTGLVQGYIGNVSLDITNRAGYEADNIHVDLYNADPATTGRKIGSTTTDNIKPGQSTRMQIPWVPPTSGSYTLFARVDPNNEIIELNETNNVITGVVVVQNTAALTGHYEESSPAIEISGDKNVVSNPLASGGSYLVGNDTKFQARFVFVGDSVAVYRHIQKETISAYAISIDSKNWNRVYYSASMLAEDRWQIPMVWDHLGDGVHTLVIENSSYSETPVNIDAIQVPGPHIATSEQMAAIDRINHYRQLIGIPPVVGRQSLHMAAQNHADFYATNYNDPRLRGLGAHQEYPDLPGFTGYGSWIRSSYYGHSNPAGISEDMSFIGDPVRAVDAWMGIVYHRVPITFYGTAEVGYGKAINGDAKVDVLDMGNLPPATESRPWPVDATFSFPADGQLNVPRSTYLSESPDPLPGVPRPVGYPINLYSLTDSTLEFKSVELKDSENQGVPVYYLKWDSDLENNDYSLFISGSLFMIPKEPLLDNSTYTAYVSGILEHDTPYEHVWSFATGSELAQPHVRAIWHIEESLPSSQPTLTVTVELTLDNYVPATQLRIEATMLDGIDYIPGSVVPSKGTTEEDGTLLFEVGALKPDQPIHLSFNVRPHDNTDSPIVVQVPMEVKWRDGSLTLTPIAILNGIKSYLPMVAR